MTARRPGESERDARILSEIDYPAPMLSCDAAPVVHEQSVRTLGVDATAQRRVMLLSKACGHQVLFLACVACATYYATVGSLRCLCGHVAARDPGWSVTVMRLPMQVSR